MASTEEKQSSSQRLDQIRAIQDQCRCQSRAKDPVELVLNEPFLESSDKEGVSGFLQRELSCPTIDDLFPYMPWVGRRAGDHIDPLHLTLVKGRQVIVTENPELHLVWYRKTFWVKPLPHCLLNEAFWDAHLAEDAVNSAYRPVALGFVRTYIKLIQHESDFKIAKESGLVPSNMCYLGFRRCLRPFFDVPDRDVSYRYQYGQLRLTRLNYAVRIFQPKARRETSTLQHLYYHELYWDTSDFVEAYLAPLAFLFATISVTLSAMQVMEAAQALDRDQWDAVIWVSWGFAVVVQLFVVLSLVVLIVPIVTLFASQAVWSWNQRGSRSQMIVRACVQFGFRKKCSDTELVALKCIRDSREDDWIEEQHFSLLHQIVFGLSRSLVEALEKDPDRVNTTDDQGRTALDWATARAQLDAMRVLIAYGSNVNNMDSRGRTTILHAVNSHNDEAVRILLKAGANPNPKMPEGVFRCSPLKAASFGGLADIVKLLLEHDADVNTCNPEGQTALHAAIIKQNVDCVVILLESDGNLDSMARNGRSPLTVAIIHNSHAVLRLFVDKRYEHIITTHEGPQLLMIIAEHADTKTISIIASSLPLKLSLGSGRETSTAGCETLRQRRDCDEKLILAFQELLFSIDIAEEEAVSL